MFLVFRVAVPHGRNKGGHLPPGAALWGRQIEVGMLGTNYEMLNVSGC